MRQVYMMSFSWENSVNDLQLLTIFSKKSHHKMSDRMLITPVN